MGELVAALRDVGFDGYVSRECSTSGARNKRVQPWLSS
jgi:hypothetical protein